MKNKFLQIFPVFFHIIPKGGFFMKKLNKILAITAFMTLLLPARCVNASTNSIEDIGTSLMNTLLERRYESYRDGSVCDTSDIMTDSESNEFYNYFAEWESRKRAALGESWIKYKYDLALTETDGNTLKFTNSVSYWIASTSSELGKYGIEYEITIGKTGKDYYITSINTTDDDEFEHLLEFTINEESKLKNSKARTISEYVDKLVDNAYKTKAKLDLVASNDKKTIKEDAVEKDVSEEDNSIMPLSTAYSYLNWFIGSGGVKTVWENAYKLWHFLNLKI